LGYEKIYQNMESRFFTLVFCRKILSLFGVSHTIKLLRHSVLLVRLKMNNAYMSAKEAALKWGITDRRVQVLCEQERIEGIFRLGNAWAIPANAEKPNDARRKPVNEDTDK
jgi:hypothetical protein